MANHTLNAIKGIAIRSSAPLDSSMGPRFESTSFRWRANAPTRPHDAGRYYQMKPLMRRVLLAAPLAAVLLASPSPAAAQPWVVAPASDGAEIISQLFWFTLVLATIVFVLV